MYLLKTLLLSLTRFSGRNFFYFFEIPFISHRIFIVISYIVCYNVTNSQEAVSYTHLDVYKRQGYITLPGGHRAGLTGQGVLEKGYIRTLKNISSINLRLARAVYGAGDDFLPYMVENGSLCHTLLASPPRAGKTTVLRDLVRQFADGTTRLPPYNVAIADERSEIAGCVNGCPQLPVGHRTDVLDHCPKAEGMMLLIRSMSPQVLVTDEIGRPEDSLALEEALHAGIKAVSYTHLDVYKRQAWQKEAIIHWIKP